MIDRWFRADSLRAPEVTPLSSDSDSAVKPPPRSWSAVAVCIVVAALLTAIDLGSKAWAIENLSRERFGNHPAVCVPDAAGYIATVRVPTMPRVVVENFFEFRYAENCGAAFGFLNDTVSIWKKVLFFGAALGAVVALLYSFRAGRGGRWFAIAVPAIISGAIGNFSDRIGRGYVVDFIRFYYRAWEYPTFNIADVAISVGVVALLVDGILEERDERRRAAEQAAARAAAEAAVPAEVAPEASPEVAREAAPEASPEPTPEASPEAVPEAGTTVGTSEA